MTWGTPAVTFAEGPDQALGTEFFGVVDQPVELGPGEFALAEVDATHGTTGIDDPAECLEPGTAQDVGQVGDLVSVAQVRLVGAEAAHRLVVTHALERNPDLDAHLGEQALDQALVDGEHVLPGHERHLDVELGEVGLAVGAKVLVAEAARDLHVAPDPGDLQAVA